LRTVNLASINHVRQRLWLRLLSNYNFAQQSCDQDASFCFLVEDMPTLREQAAKFQVSEDSYYIKWAEPSRLFHLQYLDEQLRKAALFPQTSSEVDRFGDFERNGDEMHDRLFLLTFDSAANAMPDNTDWVTEYLRKSNMSGTFFVLGKDADASGRAFGGDLQSTYSMQCVGVQGWEFRSHSHWQDWQDSVRRSASWSKQMPENYVPLFRPPDGQRRSDAQASSSLRGCRWRCGTSMPRTAPASSRPARARSGC
jgi:peptidoglycan/xylan/chitin deacetylase (PgdA/CDA1 family)